MNTIKKALNYLWLHVWKYRAVERAHRRYIRSMEDRPVRVVFFAMNISMWRYQHLYELMAKDRRFEVTVVLSPAADYHREQQQKELERLRKHLNEHLIPFIDYKTDEEPYDVKTKLNPDLVFYPQPYEHLLCPQHDCMHFYDRLVCYYPYAFWTSTGKWSYDFHFHNLAWRLYYSTPLHLQEAQRVATNHGRNVRVVGYPNADDYLRGTYDQVWKPTGRQLKRIIWAPHYSIVPEFGLPPRSNFLWMADLMLQIAHEQGDRLQLAFKPHPRLINELYRHPNWGQQRTDAYYAQWQQGENTQLEAGDFIDLFMTSDAMIHDSGSFAVEYHYTRQPVMFVSSDMSPILSTQSEFGRKAYDLHYIGKDEADVRRFIDDVVLGNNDPLRPQREQFFNDYLQPPHGKTVAENTLDDIIESLELRDYE